MNEHCFGDRPKLAKALWSRDTKSTGNPTLCVDDTCPAGKRADYAKGLEKALSDVTLGQLSHVFVSSYDDLSKGDITSLLVHAVPQIKENGDPDYSQFRNREYVRTELFNRLMLRSELAADTFIRAVSNIPDFSETVGRYLEAQVHLTFPLGHEKKILPLGTRAAQLVFRAVAFPKLEKGNLFRCIDFSDVIGWNNNVYFRPVYKTFETLDSFCILPLALFFPGKKGFALVTIQVTKSSNHVLNGTVLKRLQAQYKMVHGKELPMIHLFCDVRRRDQNTTDNHKG